MPATLRHSPRPKLFRDPIHDIIAFDQRDEVEAILLQLLQTSTFQRLRRIRQLGFANLIYHGAEHSRFAHSVGVVHTARRMFRALAPVFDDQARLEVLCAALLHDIGHGPFSHAMEAVTHIHHESYTASLIEDPDSDVHAILARADPRLPARLLRYFGPRSEFPRDRQPLRDIVSSQLDADRLDYIRRDGLATGVKIGNYDFERIQTMFELYEVELPDGERSRRLAVSYRAREAVEGYLIARFHMFKQVYLHKAVRAAEKMLEALLRRACVLYARGLDLPAPPNPNLLKLLRGERLEGAEYVSLDDNDIWIMLKVWRNAPDPVLARLSAGLLDRRLYKTIELDRQDPVQIARTIDRAQQIAREMELDPEYAVLVDRAQDTPYKPYDPDSEEGGAHIPIIAPDGTILPIEQMSDLVHLLGKDAYYTLRLCVPAELRERLRGD